MAYPVTLQGTNQNFFEQGVVSNRLVLRTGAFVTLFLEFFNLIRVLFFSGAGLGTLNNQIYFGFYLFYFLSCGLFLLFEFCFHFSVKAYYRIHMIAGSVFLFWHTFFNIYDIIRSNAVGNFTITTALMIFSALLMIRPWFALVNLTLSYLLFVVFLHFMFGSGEIINFSITFLLCVIIYLVRYKHWHIEMIQAQSLNALQQELLDTKQEFKLSAEQHELILEKEHYVTFEWNIQKDWIRFSKEWNDLFGQPCDIPQFSEYIRSLNGISQEQKSILIDCLKNVQEGAHFQKYELFLPLKTGGNNWFDLRVVTQSNKDGIPVFGIGMLSNITEQKEKISQLEQEIQMDQFTEVLNKTAIEQYGQRKLKYLQEDEMLAALILDIDDFKNVNDHFGHPAGDAVLKNVAAMMRQKAPMGARLGRIGGDEFIVLFATKNLSDFLRYGEELLVELCNAEWKGICVGISGSIGISAVGSGSHCYATLYGEADHALYCAKRIGKNRMCVYEKPLTQKYQTETVLK